MTDRIKQDINALVDSDTRPSGLPAVEPVGGIPAERGVAVYKASGSGGRGGIASPLTEPDFDQREYYESSVSLSGDYLFGMELVPVKKIKMRDANNAAVDLEFAEPPYY